MQQALQPPLHTSVPFFARKIFPCVPYQNTGCWTITHTCSVTSIKTTVHTLYRDAYFNGRYIGKGGVALLWHRSLYDNVEIIPTCTDRLAAIRLCLRDISIIIVQVYLPSANHNLTTFKTEVDALSDICSQHCGNSYLIVMGDFNARFTSKGVNPEIRTKDTYLTNMTRGFNMIAVTETPMCTGVSYTFFPYIGGRPSRIDHILLHGCMLRHVASCSVVPDAPLNVSRHLPVYLRLHLAVNTQDAVYSHPFQRVSYRWDRPFEERAYEQKLSRLLQNTTFDFSDTDSAYAELVNCISAAADSCLSRRQYNKFLKPYWSTTSKELHQNLRLSYLSWCWSGKAKDSPEHMKNKELKKNFRRQLRAAAHAQEEAERLRIDELVDADHCLFWKAVNSKKTKCKKQGSELVFNGTRECTVDGILSGWQGYLSNLYTPSQNPNYDDDHMRFVT